MELKKLFQIILESSQSLDLQSCLNKTVHNLVGANYAALSRIWLREGEQVDLRASAGRDLKGEIIWSDCQKSQHRSFTFGERKIGYIAQNNEAIYIANLQDEHVWSTDLEWADQEKIIRPSTSHAQGTDWCLGFVLKARIKP